jgi:hypothetical protein
VPDLLQHLAKCCGPFRPYEATGFVKPLSQGERLCLPGFGEHGAFFVPRQMLVRCEARKTSELAQDILPEVDANRVTKVGCLTP